jgi:hypothetical protein
MEERKKPHELIALYSLEPDIKDIYVEGVSDKELFDWFLKCHGVNDINVYVVNAVDVPDDAISRYGLNTGSNRSRLLTLSAILSEDLQPTSRVACVVDRDNEDYLPTGIANPFLEFTDYNSIELYLFNDSTMQKLVSLILGGFALSPADIIRDCIPVLEEIYLIRLSNEALAWGMEWLDFTKYIKIKRTVEFARDDFVKAYLLKNGKWSKRTLFEKKLSDLRPSLLRDPRRRVRGHDMVDLLHCIVKTLKPKRRFGDATTFQGAMTGCLEATTLASEPLFSRLLAL